MPCEAPKEDAPVPVRNENKARMTALFARFGYMIDDCLIIRREDLKKAFLEETLERNPDSPRPQKAADMALKRVLDDLLDDGSLSIAEKDIGGHVISYKTSGFKGYREGIDEPFFSWGLRRLGSGNKW